MKIISSFLIAIAAGLMFPVSAVKALQVRVTPDNPQLGDTISVMVISDDPSSSPQVSMKGQSYPAFALNQNSNNYRALLPTTPLDQPGNLTINVSGDGEQQNVTVNLKNRSFPTQRIRLSGKGSSQATQHELDRVAEFKKIVSPEKLWQGAFLRPNTAGVSTVFGVRRYYNGEFAQDYYHRGVDYAGSNGSTVVAPATGVVKLVGMESEGFRVHGNTIGIDHGQGVLSIFLHLNQINVKEGDVVRAGQKIGTVGSTGASTGPHLHWGLYVHGVSVDPVPWRFQAIQ